LAFSSGVAGKPNPRAADSAAFSHADKFMPRQDEGEVSALRMRPPCAAWSSFTSCVISSGRNFEAKSSMKSLFANTEAQCARRSASSSNFHKCTKLIDGAVSLWKYPISSPLERRKAELLIELHSLCHRAYTERVGSQFIERHRNFPSRSGLTIARISGAVLKDVGLPVNREDQFGTPPPGRL
jgi:hypothetical protein